MSAAILEKSQLVPSWMAFDSQYVSKYMLPALRA